MLLQRYDPQTLLRKKKAIKRELESAGGLLEKRIAILGGSTTHEIAEQLELSLLALGIRPIIHQGAYNQCFEEVMFDDEKLIQFHPELIYLHTSVRNIQSFPKFSDGANEVKRLLKQEFGKLHPVWEKLLGQWNIPVIQNNFEPPTYRHLGNLDFCDPRGKVSFINALNDQIKDYACSHKSFFVHDLNYLASWFGLRDWHDGADWHAYKYAMSLRAIPYVAQSLAGLMGAIFGRSRKCLVLDLDNTLWGGVIGDDGVSRIELGHETARAEAFTEFQRYCRGLRERGVLLAVCSKNDDRNAREGFSHPDSVLKTDDFSAFHANWNAKNENLAAIATGLNIGTDSLVFIDDNPAERELVRKQLPLVCVPEIGQDVEKFISVIEPLGIFETVGLSQEDLARAELYRENKDRESFQSAFQDYDRYLAQLGMKAEIKPFFELYLDRITQLTNKTNQFNLTTRRYTLPEIHKLSLDPQHLTFYGRLEDKFGDNGLVSVVIGKIEELSRQAVIELWLMSCRVLKRGMENAMFDHFVGECQSRRVKEIIGRYIQTPKNGMVADFYETLGFAIVSRKENGDSEWIYRVPDIYQSQNRHIAVNDREPVPFPQAIPGK